MDTELERHYRATTYRARTPRGVIALRIDVRDPVLAALLDEYGVRDWVFLTAWNPRSTPRSDVENRAAQGRLLGELQRCRAMVFPGEGAADSGGWDPEQSYLAIDLAAERALPLARAFEQKAFVAGHRDGPARLLWTGL